MIPHSSGTNPLPSYGLAKGRAQRRRQQREAAKLLKRGLASDALLKLGADPQGVFEAARSARATTWVKLQARFPAWFEVMPREARERLYRDMMGGHDFRWSIENPAVGKILTIERALGQVKAEVRPTTGGAA